MKVRGLAAFVAASAVVAFNDAIVDNQTPVEITKVFPEKICFRPGTQARFQIGLKNNLPADQTVRLVCAIESELDKRDVTYDSAVTVAAGREKFIEVTWPTGGAEWGFGIVASILNGNGEVLQSKSDSFAVTNRDWRVGGGLGQWTIVYDPLAPEELRRRLNTKVPERYRQFLAFLLTDQEAVERVRGTYATHLEWYSWEPSGFSSRSPKEEDWLSGQGIYYMSKPKILEVNQALQSQGIEVWSHVHIPFTGTEGLEFVRAHPEWIAYDEWGGTITGDVENLTTWGQGKPVPHSSVGPLWGTAVLMVPQAIDVHADQVIASTRKPGWDGLHSDGPPMVLPDTYREAGKIGIGSRGYRSGFKYDGTLVNVNTRGRDPDEVKKEVDERSLELWRRFTARIRKASPDFQFAMNPLGYPEPGLFEQTYSNKGWCMDGYILNEGFKSITEKGEYYNLWTNYIQGVQKLGADVKGWLEPELQSALVGVKTVPRPPPGRRYYRDLHAHSKPAVLARARTASIRLPTFLLYLQHILNHRRTVGRHAYLELHEVRFEGDCWSAALPQLGAYWQPLDHRHRDGLPAFVRQSDLDRVFVGHRVELTCGSLAPRGRDQWREAAGNPQPLVRLGMREVLLRDLPEAPVGSNSPQQERACRKRHPKANVPCVPEAEHNPRSGLVRFCEIRLRLGGEEDHLLGHRKLGHRNVGQLHRLVAQQIYRI